MKKAITLIFFIGSLIQLQAQQRSCGMEAHMETLLQDPAYRQAHEQKLARMAEFSQSAVPRMVCADPVQLPVAVHFQGISNPDAACLIALAQNQIDILNDDIQGTNGDITEWSDDASSFFPGINNGEACIEFCLASQNHPPGFGLQDGDLAVTINQTNGDFNAAWSGYINIFVRNIGPLGYSPLGGNGNGDGVTVDIQAFASGAGCGQVSPNPPYDLGRTVTHEIGHYLLLYHIWRNDGCGLDDDVADTPLQDDEYFGCPANGVTSCGSADMHMNYMDYVNDACMYMFSAGQATRMENYMNTNLLNVINNAANVCSAPPPASCDDGIQNGSETGVDCGGPDCDPCQTVSCDDGILNGNETGVDCGGPDCPPCQSSCTENPVTLTITLDLSGQQTSWDLVDNAGGATVASGGPYPGAQLGTVIEESFCLDDGCYTFTIYDSAGNGLCCRAGQGSYTLIDDTSGNIIASGSSFGFFESTVFCFNDSQGSCSDGIQNGSETDVDCGGPDCLPCQGASCSDGIQNGNETGIDCGGPDCDPCAECNDGVQNGNETGVDCGGPDCPPCQTASCNDGIQNGSETGVDCGGPDCDPCPVADCSPPGNSYVEFLADPKNVIIHWEEIPAAIYYEIRYRIAGTTNWTTRTAYSNAILLARLLTGTEYEYQLRSLCSDGWTDWTTSEFFTTNTAREELPALQLQHLYPNPARHQLYLDLAVGQAAEANILITDVLGRTVRQYTVTLHQGYELLTLDLQGLEAGYYQLTVSAENASVTAKFIRQ